MATKVKAITYEESLTTPEVTYEEIVNGEVRTMPPPRLKHQRLIHRLAVALDRQLDPGTVEILQNYGQAIRKRPAFTYRIPDFAVFLRATMVRQDEYYVWSPPELLVEVISRSYRRKDLEELLVDYEAIALAELWVLDMDERAVRRFRLQDARLREIASILRGAVAPLRFPNVTVDVDKLWRTLDEG